MRIGLVSPATVLEFDGPRAPRARDLCEHVPLGVLALAAMLRRRGDEVLLFDSNLLLAEHRASDGDRSGWMADRLRAAKLDLAGFGTLSSSYPLSLRVAAALRAIAPSLPILLGGPQASATDVPTLEAFPAVDFVLRGEADHSILELAGALERGDDLSATPGLTFRRSGAVLRAPDAALPLDLDALPLPAYDLFPPLDAADTLPLEVGRGCPYGCTFCSTNEFFRRRFRLKSPARVVAQLRELSARYGVRRFDFVHDMLTVNRAAVLSLCEAIEAERAGFEWLCSARTDRVDDELLRAMAAAGCRGVFFGIETGSPRLQRLIKKRLDLTEAARALRSAADRGMQVVASLIAGFPDEDLEDLGSTADFFARSLRSPRVTPQLHLLAPLAGTPLHQLHRASLVLDRHRSDLSRGSAAPDAEEQRWIGLHPEVFSSFHSIPGPVDRGLLAELRLFLVESAVSFRALLAALASRSRVLDCFLEFRAQRRLAVPDESDLAAWYESSSFRAAVARFVRARFAADAAWPALESLLRLHEAEWTALDPSRPAAVARLSVDFLALFAALRAGNPLDELSAVELFVAVKPAGRGRLEYHQLHPLAGHVLAACNGDRSTRHIARRLREAGVRFEGRRPTTSDCASALEVLEESGLLGTITAAD